jgi:hypothetical protein
MHGRAVMTRRLATRALDDVDLVIAGLDDEPAAQLVARWRSLTGRLPGPGLRGELLRAALAHKIQEHAHGGLSTATLKKLKALAKAHQQQQADIERSAQASALIVRTIKPGSRLMREWQGVVHEVIVDVDGYRWEGQSFSSLSSIAKSITGTSWNGWRFFGINQGNHRPKTAQRPATKEEARDATSSE